MAKPGVSKKSRQPSVHSRAARRATDVDIDTDKSLKNVKAPSDTTDHRPSVLAAQHNSGVSKKSKNRKSQLSAKAKKRQERGADRAAAIMERTANKIEKSKNQSKSIQARSKGWEEVNKQAPAKKFPDEEDLEQEERKGRKQIVADKDWETDEEMDGAEEDAAPAAPAAVPANAAAAAAAPPQTDDLDEDIL
ncbi:hypothetical protein Cob_v007685 [Colletotrichum orbiculare MAFF 240422]|uniref:Microfibril-associated protein n=1 Tax=Colletotrichum orbiculare (strain 104-T / ATCC 96160 / CBS 514.97 / LARS 414 / MAFF 240422) TaxID=1213857 RepID=A0A484FMS2_COLOR|nr:hypothetical protein Cob_v007685 [Colletotrichum orbiculare MAFF 240422]